jgi:hypothetical protein
MTRPLGHSFLYAIGINYGPDARFAATPTWPALPRIAWSSGISVHSFCARRAIFHFRFATRMREQLIRRRAFRTKVSLTDRRLRVAFDRNQFAVLVINELTATDSAVRANRAGDACTIGARMHRASFVRHRLQPSPVRPPANLTNERPF